MDKENFIHGYLTLVVVLFALRVIVKLCMLSGSEYPRSITYSRGDDAISVFFGAISVVVLLWALS
jgi:hypothetical protein